MGIAKLAATVLDCPDPTSLAKFYESITGWPVVEIYTSSDAERIVGWAYLENESGGATIGFARVDNYRAPTWPEGEIQQQEHLEFAVADLDRGEAAILEIGARKADFQPGTTFRVFLDPAGHPFCLIKSR
jgi:catechol 2,3-dioxygenase-like lactoylglutathione lyase family enzyme